VTRASERRSFQGSAHTGGPSTACVSNHGRVAAAGAGQPVARDPSAVADALERPVGNFFRSATRFHRSRVRAAPPQASPTHRIRPLAARERTKAPSAAAR